MVVFNYRSFVSHAAPRPVFGNVQVRGLAPDNDIIHVIMELGITPGGGGRPSNYPPLPTCNPSIMPTQLHRLSDIPLLPIYPRGAQAQTAA